jgi:hypothetical protein
MTHHNQKLVVGCFDPTLQALSWLLNQQLSSSRTITTEIPPTEYRQERDTHDDLTGNHHYAIHRHASIQKNRPNLPFIYRRPTWADGHGVFHAWAVT